MTDEDRLLLNDLRNNAERLFQEFKEMDTANKILQSKIAVIEQEIALLRQEKVVLSRENERIRIANQMLSGSEENREAKKRINNIVREIDKCIALLNK